MSRSRYDDTPLVPRPIRIKASQSEYFNDNGINLSLVCRDYIDEFMELKEVPQKYFLNLHGPRQNKKPRKGH